MPRKAVFSASDIENTAFALVREGGWDKLSAPAVAERLGCSTMPIYSHFKNMEDLERAVLERAWALLMEREGEVATGDPWVDQALAYARFSREEKHLFHSMFDGRHLEQGNALRLRHWEYLAEQLEGYEPFSGIDPDTLKKIRFARAMFTHGVASAISAGWSDLFDDEEMVRRFIQVVSRSLLQGMKEMLPGPDAEALRLRTSGRGAP